MTSLSNSVHLIGNLGQDPEVRELDNGRMMARFSLATSDTYRNQAGEKVTNTDWHHLVAWGRQAKIASKYLHKGDKIAVEGKLTTRSWEDKNGEKHYVTEVQVNQILMLRNKK